MEHVGCVLPTSLLLETGSKGEREDRVELTHEEPMGIMRVEGLTSSQKRSIKLQEITPPVASVAGRKTA